MSDLRCCHGCCQMCTLSKSALVRFKRFPDGHLSLRGRFPDISGRQRTPTTETKTETTAPCRPPACKLAHRASLTIVQACASVSTRAFDRSQTLLLLHSAAAPAVVPPGFLAWAVSATCPLPAPPRPGLPVQGAGRHARRGAAGGRKRIRQRRTPLLRCCSGSELRYARGRELG